MPSVLDDELAPDGGGPKAPPPGGSVLGAGMPGTRAFGDAAATRANIYEGALRAARAIEPVTNTKHTLSLHDVDYADPDEFSLAKQKDAALSGKSLHRRLRGTWRLTDNESGKVLDEKHTTVAHVPHMSQRGTFLVNGSDYILKHQLRLNPGIYTRAKANGELESHVNVMPGKGASHRYFLDPETNLFKINLGQAKMPLSPLLRAMGVTDKEMHAAWGPEIAQANAGQDDKRTMDKLYAKLVRKGDPDADAATKRAAVADAISKMEVDPDVTERTLGGRHANVDRHAIMATTRKLLAVSRGEAEPDDRDHMAYQTLHGPEDLIAERLGKDKTAMRQLLWKATYKGNLQHVLPGALTKQVQHAILHSGLGNAAEEVNPAEMLDAQTSVSRMGEGGIPSMASVPDESRSVHPSQFAFVDPIRTPESFATGVDMRITSAARKGPDGRIYAPFNDFKTGKTVYRSPKDVRDKVVAFPSRELVNNEPYVYAMVDGVERLVPRETVDLVQPHFENSFSPLGNMVPAKSGIKGQRMSMGSRYLGQALSLVNREAAHVQAAMPGGHGVGDEGRSYDQHYGEHMGAVRGDPSQGGKVTKVGPDGVTVQYDDGTERTHELYDHFPLARKSYLHNEAVVQPGQRIEPGQALASSNFTDPEGTTALGLNARIAFVPFRGANFEDAQVISESFAKRLESHHMYQHHQDWTDKHAKGLDSYRSLFPAKYDKATLENMDEHGVAKKGTVLNYGDPVILAAEERELAHSKVHRGHGPSFADKSQVWEHHAPGVVTDVHHGAKGSRVAIKTVNPMSVGDKLSNRQGGKGVVAQILPDHEMPHDEDGRPFEMTMTSLGTLSRINPGQHTAETVLGKIAERTGKPYKVEDFSKVDDLRQFSLDELRKHGMKDKETIIDPMTGRRIPNVLTGSQYLLKLHQQAEHKASGRSTGAYTADGVPAKGGPEGSKRLSMLDSNALLSHGATEILRDAHLVRGQKNDDYWQAFMSGHRPPEPKVPFVYEKFHAHLRAAGINPVRNGTQTHVMAMDRKTLDDMVGDRELNNADTVDWKEGLKPKKGGLFDPSLTGGHNGNRWSAIRLHEPMPSPAFEEPIRRVLGLTQKGLEGVLAGTQQLNKETGPRAIADALEAVDVDRMIAQAKQDAAGNKKGARDDAIRKLRYLSNAKRLGIHPRDWVMDRVPVLPPMFRPVSTMVGGAQLVSDPNYLYRELFDANDNLSKLSGQVADVGQERLDVYNAFKGVVGLGDPITPKNQERGVKGVLRHVFGTSPKFGSVQRQLLGTTVDTVGSAVITPNPDYDMDSVGIPEDKAWSVYAPFIVRRLVQHGVPRMDAARALKDRTQQARDAMVKEMDHRPVIISRAPVLHRYGIMAFMPRLVKGDTMQVSPLITKGFNADFDGDQMSFHIPVGEEARKEAMEKMLPSRNLLSSSNFKAHQMPGQEYQGGLHTSSTAHNDKKHARTFASAADARAAYARGEMHIGDPVVIVNH